MIPERRQRAAFSYLFDKITDEMEMTRRTFRPSGHRTVSHRVGKSAER
jgi:hypothetical protein